MVEYGREAVSHVNRLVRRYIMANSKHVRSLVDGLWSDLRDKVAGGRPADDDMLRRAAAAIAVLGETFEKHAIAEVEKMYRLFREGADIEGKRQENAEAIYDIAHDLRGQGTTFEYPLVTRICSSLCTFIAARKKSGVLDADDFEVICVHLDALNAVLALRVIGDGGPTGQEIGEGLETAVEKLLT